MTEAKQPEALRLADRLQNAVATYPQVSEDEPGGYCQEVDQVMDEAAAELRRLHDHIADLEAQLESIGAGGVSPLMGAAGDAGWQPIETAPEGQMVVVGWFDPEDHDTPERHDFDMLEDGCWQKWHEHAEYVEVIGGHGVSYTAPYTSWMPVPAIPAPSSVD